MTRTQKRKSPQRFEDVRALAIKLYEAGQAAKREQPPEIWGSDRLRKWSDLPTESVAVWDSIAICAQRQTTHMTKVQKRKFTLALNAFAKARKDYYLTWADDKPFKLSDRLFRISEIKRARLYRVVEELVGGK